MIISVLVINEDGSQYVEEREVEDIVFPEEETEKDLETAVE